MAGCLQIALYVATVPMEPFSGFIQGVVLSSWPLAVAAVLFALLDIRMHQNSVVQVVQDEPEIPEAPLRPKSRTVEKPVSYFNVEPAPEAAPVQAPGAPAPQPAPGAFNQSGSVLFATPPPFQQVPPSQPSAVSATVPLHRVAADAQRHEPQRPVQGAPAPMNPEGKPEQEGLSFFKL